MLTFTMDNRRVVVEPRDTSRHFEKNTLTHAQVGRIIENCVKMLEDNRDYLYFGVILLVAMGITISELCVLTWRSFSSSNTYTGVTVIVAEAKVAGEVYCTEELSGLRRQTLPLSPTVAKLHINKEYHAWTMTLRHRSGGCQTGWLGCQSQHEADVNIRVSHSILPFRAPPATILKNDREA